jgi:NADH-quinone oxidoreductase subunit H
MSFILSLALPSSFTSAVRWSFFFLAEYASMFLVSAVAAILFLGGWDDGFGVVRELKSSSTNVLDWGVIAGNLLGAGMLMMKASVLVLVQIWVRWTLPRLRIDQVMTTCLKYLLPMSCALFLAAVVYPMALVLLTGRPQILPLSNDVPAAAEVSSINEVEVEIAAVDGEVIE